jgi:hypothetical protein
MRWVPTITTAGTCGNGHRREWECDIVGVRVTHGARTGRECKRGQYAGTTADKKARTEGAD